MDAAFHYDVFLSHSSKDKSIVRGVAERLRASGLRVWFDEWDLKPGDSIPAKIEEGLERSRVLVLCMSANAFGSDWAQLEAGTFRFRDPLNKGRRFIPLRLDDAPIKGSLAQFLYINWRSKSPEQEYAKLLDACRDPTNWRADAKDKDSDANALSHLAVIRARRNEWKRLRDDFEAEARQYHDVKMSVFYIAKDGPIAQDNFPEPNHAISLWQYYGSTRSRETMDRLRSLKITDFGMSGAELSAFGLVVGEQTNLFCKMAKRSGSLLPDKININITERIFKIFEDAKEPGKPIVVANSNPLAKWLNLMLISTITSHPGRFKDAILAADPFAASLTVFDYFRLDE